MSQAARTAHLRINRRDKRCMMVNLDPQTATQDPAVLREIVQRRDMCTGLYATPSAWAACASAMSSLSTVPDPPRRWMRARRALCWLVRSSARSETP